MNGKQEIIEAIDIMIQEAIKTTTKITNGTCVKLKPKNKCDIVANGKTIENISYYGNSPKIGSQYRVFMPDGNANFAFIIVTEENKTGKIINVTSDYTLQSGDENATVIFNNNSGTVNVIIPTDSVCNFPIGTKIFLLQKGTGFGYVNFQSGVNVYTYTALNVNNRYVVRPFMCTITKVDSNSWEVTNDRTAQYSRYAQNLGTATVGSESQPIYIKDGVPTAASALPSAELTMDLLWSNQNITALNFPQQQISVDLSKYKLVYIEAAIEHGNAATYISTIVVVGSNGNLNYTLLNEYTEGILMVRTFETISNAVTFSNAYRRGFINTAIMVDNSYLVPYKIYGIK